MDLTSCVWWRRSRATSPPAHVG